MILEERRKPLFKYLRGVLKVADKKFQTDNRDNGERLKWGRLIIQAVSACGVLLKDEDLELRVRELEEKIKNAVVIPNEPKKKS